MIDKDTSLIAHSQTIDLKTSSKLEQTPLKQSTASNNFFLKSSLLAKQQNFFNSNGKEDDYDYDQDKEAMEQHDQLLKLR